MDTKTLLLLGGGGVLAYLLLSRDKSEAAELEARAKAVVEEAKAIPKVVAETKTSPLIFGFPSVGSAVSAAVKIAAELTQRAQAIRALEEQVKALEAIPYPATPTAAIVGLKAQIDALKKG